MYTFINGQYTMVITHIISSEMGFLNTFRAIMKSTILILIFFLYVDDLMKDVNN